MTAREAWFQRYGGLHGTNGYSFPPWAIYDQFLPVVDRPGRILELGCGNGLLLRYLCDLSGRALQPFGVDNKEPRIQEARTIVFPECPSSFVQGDLREGVHHRGSFAVLMVNPLYADHGYYEQVDGKIPRLYLDGSVAVLVKRCWESVAPGGRLVLWCYDGHIAEIAAQLDDFRTALAQTGITFQERASGPVTFLLADRPRRAYRPRRSERPAGAIVDRASPLLTSIEADILSRCDGQHSLSEIAGKLARPGLPGTGESAAVSMAVHRLFRAGLLETIEEAALRSVLAFHGPRFRDLRLVEVCTGDYFTAVRLNDGSQGAAINFNNVSGPHRTSFNHRHYDYLLTRLLDIDPLLSDTFLRQGELDCLGQSVRVAVLNALSCRMLTPERLRTVHGLDLHDGYLDLASFFRPSDTVAMIGCTGNYSCREVGKLSDLGTIYFSDFEYVEPFKAGIVDCIRQNFVRPEKVVPSAGQDNEAICRKADVVVLIADTLCTNTLDELLIWSSSAREVLITGRSYAMDPIHLFDRGASAITTQRITQPDYIGFVRDKIQRGEFGFTERLVACFQRMYAVRQ